MIIRIFISFLIFLQLFCLTLWGAKTGQVFLEDKEKGHRIGALSGFIADVGIAISIGGPSGILYALVSLGGASIARHPAVHVNVTTYPKTNIDAPLIRNIYNGQHQINLVIGSRGYSEAQEVLNYLKSSISKKISSNYHLVLNYTSFEKKSSLMKLRNSLQLDSDEQLKQKPYLIIYLEKLHPSDCSLTFTASLLNAEVNLMSISKPETISLRERCPTKEIIYNAEIEKLAERITRHFLPRSWFFPYFYIFSEDSKFPELDDKIIKIKILLVKIITYDIPYEEKKELFNAVNQLHKLSNDLLIATKFQSDIAYYYYGISFFLMGDYENALYALKKSRDIYTRTNRDSTFLRDLIKDIESLDN